MGLKFRRYRPTVCVRPSVCYQTKVTLQYKTFRVSLRTSYTDHHLTLSHRKSPNWRTCRLGNLYYHEMNTRTSTAICLVFLMAVAQVHSGLIGILAYGACQTGCNAGWVACCSAAGVTAGTVTAGLGVPAAVMACSALQGTCMAACAALALAPTP
ncbi:hypothetical protein BV898_11493 [Hypsibius exemplaris]|uniref:Uncharacterized protein n=1 Tax=Hypsibius exemplaris TaxID=2072580 RepID=A0A1W0WGC4_HYPEX|nr:hypothetical protein BV898_11493 [Hypsibius exemplaris]